MPQTTIEERFELLVKAFEKDNFDVKNLKKDPQYAGNPYVSEQGYMIYQGKIGLLAESRDAINVVTKAKKRVYYLEGSNYQMGYVLGLLAEPEVSRMTNEFAENMLTAFFKSSDSQRAEGLFDYIKKIIVGLIGDLTKTMKPDIPDCFKDEISGLLNGCERANPKTKVREDALYALNFGFDFLLSHVYTGKVFAEKKIPPFLLNIPVMCNAYSVYGDVVRDSKHYFGRDFMFPPAGVYQDTACLIIYNPDPIPDQKKLLSVSQTAPGIVGSMAVMNIEGMAIGVDMSPTYLCTPERPGLNSLMLLRDCMEHCATFDEVVNHVLKAPRGVSWLYPIADGKTDQAAVLETGANIGSQPFPYLQHLPDHYKKGLQKQQPALTEAYITQKQEKYRNKPPENGMITRKADYTYPSDYISDFNKRLWDLFNSDSWPRLEELAGDLISDLAAILKHESVEQLLKTLLEEAKELLQKVPYDSSYFTERGYINKTWTDKHCPGPFYFAPQRETEPYMALVSNHNISPEMRLMAMQEWVALVAGSNLNDIQWRYDELNNELLQAIDDAQKGVKIDHAKALDLIDFLRPTGKFPTYRNKDGGDPDKIVIHGSISLCELKEKVIDSHFGYYGDKWVTIHLPYYKI